MKIPITIQMQPGENGAAALCMLLAYHKRFVPMAEMREKCVSSRNGSSPEQILSAAESYGLVGEYVKADTDQFFKGKLPVIVCWKRRYYTIVKSLKGNIVTVVDPSRGEYKLTRDKFDSIYSGGYFELKKGPDFAPGGKRESLFGLLSKRIFGIKKVLILLFILSLICILTDLALNNVQKDFLDDIVGKPNHDEGKAFLYQLALYALMISYTVFSLLKTKLVLSASRNKSAESGSKLFKKMFNQPLKFFEQYSAGELMTRIENNIQLDNSILQSLVPRFIDVFMTILYFIMLMRYNSVIALICLGIEIIYLFISLKYQQKNAIASRSMATSSGSLNTSILNGMNMIDTIKSTGAERSFYNIWYQTQSRVNENKMTRFWIQGITTLINSIHNYSLTIVQLFLGAYFVKNGHFTIGMMSLFQSVLNNMRNSLGNCLNSVNTLQSMRTNIERVNDINNRDVREPIPLSEEDKANVDKLDGNIVAKDICFRYNSGDELAVDHVSLEVKRGQMVALVGETGCGKSTLLKILADLYEAESGEILYSGKKRNQIPDVVFHSSITSVDQETVVFEDSIFSNIKMWDETIEDYEVLIAARDAQIHSRISRERDGYSSTMLENGKNFSGGELQRLELARALSHEPTMLFLDEFTSALDALTEDKVIRSIRDKGTTCVIVAHRLSTIVDCDRIYVLDKGKIVEEGTHDELYKLNGLYTKLIGTQ